MRACLVVTIATIASATVSLAGVLNPEHHDASRRLSKRAIPLLAYKSGGSGASSSLPNHIDPNLGQSSAMLNQMATGASMAQPLWISGVTMILISFAMGMQYMAAANRVALARSYRGNARSSGGDFVPAYLDSAAQLYSRRR